MEIGIQDIFDPITRPSSVRSFALLLTTIVVVYWLSRFVSKGIIFFARIIAKKSDDSKDLDSSLKFRRLETYLSSLIAGVRLAAALVIAYIIWRAISPASGQPASVIGASALFIVIGSGVVGPLLNDAVAGFTMIIERWYSVGDFIKVEPFWNVSGVVERVTLRSTKLRSVSGEIVWVHNRTVSGVHVTPFGVRSISIDVFVNNPEKARKIIRQTITTLPLGATTLTESPSISTIAEVTEGMWRVVIEAKTAPGREWLIENFFVSSLKESDAKLNKPVIVHGPVVRFVDSEAEKGFKRAVQMNDKQWRAPKPTIKQRADKVKKKHS